MNKKKRICEPLKTWQGAQGFAFLSRKTRCEKDDVEFLDGLTDLTEEGYSILSCGLNELGNGRCRLWAILNAKIVEKEEIKDAPE